MNFDFTKAAQLNSIFKKVNAGCFNIRLIDGRKKTQGNEM
jgi:hypothetical protein